MTLSLANGIIRTSPSPTAPIAKVVPSGWVLCCLDEHDDQQKAGGYIWWEVEDTTEGLRGWMAARTLTGDTRYLSGSPEDEARQQELRRKADPSYADTKDERVAIIREAVLHYFSNNDTMPSLYSSNDKARNGTSNALSHLQEYGFPVAVVFAIIAQESGGIAYSNVGDGVMQIDWEPNKGLASNIQCFSSECRCYGNTKQSIYANVKDGLKVLRDFYVPLRTREAAYILATWKYNGGVDPTSTYCKCRGDPFYLVHIGMRLSGNDLLEEKHVCKDQTFACHQCTGGTCTRSSSACGYSVSPTVADFGFDLQSELGDSFKRYQRDNVSVAVCSEADVLIRDSEGRLTGLVQGMPVEEIPYSLCLGKAVVVFMASGEYRYEVVGTGYGSYGLVINLSGRSQALSLTAFDIPVKAGSVHVYQVDWDALARGEKGVTVQIDQDGDGVFERTIQAGSELRGDDIGVVPPGSALNHGPNPVPPEGCTFWFNLPPGTQSAKLLIYNVAGRLVVEIPLDPTATRYPATGRWNPVDRNGVPLANGPYVYVLIADGRVIGQGKMVIQR